MNQGLLYHPRASSSSHSVTPLRQKFRPIVAGNADGTLNFINSGDAVPALKNFKRLALGEVGSVSGTVCLGGMSETGCVATATASKSSSELTYSYTLIGVDAVE